MSEDKSIPAQNLTKIMADIQSISQSIYKSFKIGQQFVNGIDDYIRYKQTQGVIANSLGPEWRSFTNAYAKLVWNSRDICATANFRVMEFQNIFSFLTNKDMPLEAKKAKVQSFMQTPDTTSDESEDLAVKFQELQGKVNEWKGKLAHTLPKNDGSSRYGLLAKDLRDLRNHLMSVPADAESFDALNRVWMLDTVKPMAVGTAELTKAWRSVFNAARFVLNNILDASIGESDWEFNTDVQHVQEAYKALGEALNKYGDVIRTSDIYPGYQNALKEGK